MPIKIFLESLESSITQDLFTKIMPASVPSNLEIHRLNEEKLIKENENYAKHNDS